MRYCVTINNKRYEVEVEKEHADILKSTKIMATTKDNKDITLKQVVATTEVPQTNGLPDDSNEETKYLDRTFIKAPMAGIIVDIKVSVGSEVKMGDEIFILEAMKMENGITSHVSGVVVDIKVIKGENVSVDDVLIELKQ